MLPIVAALVLQIAAVSSESTAVSDTTRRATQYRLERWTDVDGLPQNSIASIARTTDGFLWLASEEGLIRFDGARFRVFNPANTPALSRSQVMAVAAAPDGALWIATTGSGLLRYHDGEFRSWTTREGLSSDRVQAVAVSPSGEVWVGTNKGVVRIDAASRMRVLGIAGGLPSDEITALAVTPTQDVWIGTMAGLVKVTRQGMQVFGTGDGLPDPVVRAIRPARDGGLWVGTNRGIVRYDGQRFRVVDSRLADKAVISLAEEGNGALWIGTNGDGLYRLLNGRLERLGNRDGAAEIVWALEVDHDGIVWAGTNGRGLMQLRQAPFVPFGPPEGLSGEIALAVLETRGGERWIGTAGAGLNRIRSDGTVIRYAADAGLEARNIISLAELPNGDILIGSQMGLLTRYSRGSFTSLGPRYGLRHSVMAILPDPNGGVWLGLAGGGVMYVDAHERRTTIGEDEGLAENFVMALHRTGDGALWVGTRQGVSRIENGRVVASAAARGTAGVAVAAFHERRDGSLWLATQGNGVGAIIGDNVKFLNRSAGLCEDLIHAIVDDGFGHTWMSTNQGIARIRTEELEDYFAGRRTRVGCTMFDTGAGMRSREANGGFMPAAAHLRDGRIMFPTMQGVVTVDPRQLRSAAAPPQPVIEAAVLGDDTLHVGGGANLRVDNAGRNLEIRFTAPEFQAPDRLRFRFRLEGFDKAWQDAGTRRTAYYTNLPPGEYTFHVMAGNEESGWRAAEAVSVEVPAHFYETWWFYVATGVMLIVSAWSLHRYRLNIAARNAARLAALVEDRTRAEERYRDLFENATDMVFTSSLDGTILSWNAEAERLTGYPKHEAIGAPIVSILPQIGDISNLARRDITFTRRNGEPAAIEIATRVIRENGNPVGYQVIGRDVYEWRRMQMQLQQAAKMEAIGQLAGGVAHDFNNLLTVITGSTEMLRAELPEESPLRADLDHIRAAADNAAGLTRQLLAFSRRQVLQPRILNMNDQVTTVVGMLRRVIGVNITLETELPDELWPVYADAVQLEQVIMNLALNARDAMPKGGLLRLRTRNVEMDAARGKPLRIPAGRYIELMVEDTGQGIDPSTLPHLFEPFFTTKDAGLGTGLGLATVYGVVKQSGGHIIVDSRPGAGTRFYVYLPAAEGMHVATDGETDGGERDVDVPQHLRVLLVDDEPAVSHLAHKILSRSGFDVRVAGGGAEALRLLDESGPVDLLLTDIMMPEMNGRELAHAVLSRYPGTAILYMSGYTEDEVIRRGDLPRGEHFIGKPFTPSALVNAVLGTLKLDPSEVRYDRVSGAA